MYFYFTSTSKLVTTCLGLRKVTDDMKTHKNPNLRKTGPVPSKQGQQQAAAPAVPKQVAKKKNPVFELQGGKKWIVVCDITVLSNYKTKVC